MPSQAGKINRSLLLRIIGTVGSVGLLFYLLYQQGWNEILAVLGRITWWEVAAAFLAVLISRLATAARWYVILRALGVGIPAGESISLTFAGLFAANFLPTTVGGDIARLTGAIQMKYDGAKCAASLVLDRLTGMLGMLLIMPFGIPIFSKLFHLANGHHATTTALVSQMMNCEEPKKTRNITVRLRRGIGRTFEAFGDGLRKPGHLFGALCFTWIHMLGYFVSIAVLLSGMKEPLSFLMIAEGWTIVYFLTLLPISINGLGVQEISIAYIYTRMGVSGSAAIGTALFIRTFSILASLPGAVFIPSIMVGTRQQPGENAECEVRNAE